MLMGMLILIFAVIFFIATIPAIAEIANTPRGCTYLNCAGYVDVEASGTACGSANQSYVNTIDSNTLGCTTMDLFIPLLILGVLVGLISKLMSGQLTDAPQPVYPQY